MAFEKYLAEGDVFVFCFDEVLYPEKDFLLQVYYLFANFLEYGEQQPANDILQFMKADYEAYGAEGIFERTAVKWNIPHKYKLNFDLLLTGARLPLKLELFPQMLDFLMEIKNSGKLIFLLLGGIPEQQLNKIRQTNWQELAESLVVYFIEETQEQSTSSGLIHIIKTHNLDDKRIVFVGADEGHLNAALVNKIKYVDASELLVN